jgi:hypothetical protein
MKADVSEAGEGRSDSRIIAALDTSASMVYRVRKQLVEEGFEAVLNHKQRKAPAVSRIFDGEKGAELIALACSKPPKGRARWTMMSPVELCQPVVAGAPTGRGSIML